MIAVKSYFIYMKRYFFPLFLLLLLVASPAVAVIDSDGDGVSDEDEINVYYTNPNNVDTDGDGFDDYTEITNDYSPHAVGERLWSHDYDKDGLNDKLERVLGTDLGVADTDGDGYSDGVEVYHGYDPLRASPTAILPQKIEIGIKEQRLRISSGRALLGEFPVSTGTYKYPTPLGLFKIDSKKQRAWSGSYGLWMPWWMSFSKGIYGIHELPEWPSGIKEGLNHLGHRVSHGCVRLGIDAAKLVYDWARLGTPVEIKETLY